MTIGSGSQTVLYWSHLIQNLVSFRTNVDAIRLHPLHDWAMQGPCKRKYMPEAASWVEKKPDVDLELLKTPHCMGHPLSQVECTTSSRSIIQCITCVEGLQQSREQEEHLRSDALLWRWPEATHNRLLIDEKREKRIRLGYWKLLRHREAV